MAEYSSFLDEAFDADAEEGTNFELIPVGRYQAEIITASVGPTKNHRGQMIKLEWQIVEGATRTGGCISPF